MDDEFRFAWGCLLLICLVFWAAYSCGASKQEREVCRLAFAAATTASDTLNVLRKYDFCDVPK